MGALFFFPFLFFDLLATFSLYSLTTFLFCFCSYYSIRFQVLVYGGMLFFGEIMKEERKLYEQQGETIVVFCDFLFLWTDGVNQLKQP